MVTNELSKKKIKFIKHYSDTGDDTSMGTNENDSIQIKESHVNIITVHGSKGLEFNKVLLLNFHFCTYGRKPTVKEFNIFKYLWYVGLTRACSELKIYVLVDIDDNNRRIQRTPFPLLLDCPSNLFLVENNKLMLDHKINFETETNPEFYSVTELLAKFQDTDYAKMADMIKYEVTTTDIFASKPLDITIDGEKIDAVLGIFIENLYEFYYKKKFNQTISIVLTLKTQLENLIVVLKKFKCSVCNYDSDKKKNTSKDMSIK